MCRASSARLPAEVMTFSKWHLCFLSDRSNHRKEADFLWVWFFFLKTIFSRTFSRSLDIGPKYERTVTPTFVFLRNCYTLGCLKSAGMVPVRRVALIMDNTRSSIVSKTSLKRRVETMLRWHIEGFEWETSSAKLNRETGSKWSKTANRFEVTERS